jgi:hypothetical protein
VWGGLERLVVQEPEESLRGRTVRSFADPVICCPLGGLKVLEGPIDN